MNLILVFSILVRLAAAAWALLMVRRKPEIHLILLTVMLFLASLALVYPLLSQPLSWSWQLVFSPSELTRLLTSLLLFMATALIARFVKVESRNSDSLRHNEKQARLLNARLQLFVERMPLAFITLDTDFLITGWNPAAESIFGFTAAEALGKHPFDLIVPPAAHAEVSVILDRLRSGEPDAHHFNRNITKDGRSIICSWLNEPLKDAAGNVTGMFCMAQDVTAQKDSEERLRVSEQRYRNLFDLSPEYVLTIDTAGIVTSTNASVIKMGYSREQFIGRHFTQLPMLFAEESPRYLKFFRDLLEKGLPVSFVTRYFHQDGSLHWGEVHIGLIDLGENQRCIHALWSDITQNKLATEKNLRLSNLLKAERKVNQLIIHETSREHLLQMSCQALIEECGYDKAWIMLLDDRQTPLSVTSAGVGIQGNSFLDHLRSGAFPACVQRVLSQPELFLAYHCPETDNQCFMGKIHRNLAVLRYRMELGSRVYGVIGAILPAGLVIDKEEQELFQEVCGDITFGLKVIQENEKRKQTDAALKHSEEKYRHLVDTIQEGIWVLDKAGNTTFVNPHMAQMLGYSVEEMQAKHAFSFMDQRGRAIAENLLQKRRQGLPQSVDFEFLKKDGSRVYTLLEAKVSLDASGNYDGAIAAVTDITDRRRLEEDLLKLKAAVETAPEVIFLTDPQGLFTYVNPEFTRLYGFTPEETVGKLTPRILKGGFVDPQQYQQFWQAILAKQAVRGELINKAKDGRLLSIDGSANAVLNEAGEIVAFLAIQRDVSEKKRIERQLVVTDRLASVGELAAGMAHEINNPLTGVIGLSELLLADGLPAQFKGDLETIHSEAQRAAKIVRNLLIFARKQPQEKLPVEVNDIISKVIQMRAYEHRVNNISVETHFAADLPQLIANAFQLQQVFINIIINAEFFMTQAHHRGTLTITTRQVGDCARLSFQDDGPGIPPDNMRYLFSPFFTTKDVGKGTGLGLSICHGIIAEHGGKICAESQPGQGSTFIIELPVVSTARQKAPL